MLTHDISNLSTMCPRELPISLYPKTSYTLKTHFHIPDLIQQRVHKHSNSGLVLDLEYHKLLLNASIHLQVPEHFHFCFRGRFAMIVCIGRKRGKVFIQFCNY